LNLASVLTFIYVAEERFVSLLNERIIQLAGDVDQLKRRVQQLEGQLGAISVLQAKVDDLQVKIHLEEAAGTSREMESKMLNLEAKLAAAAAPQQQTSTGH